MSDESRGSARAFGIWRKTPSRYLWPFQTAHWLLFDLHVQLSGVIERLVPVSVWIGYIFFIYAAAIKTALWGRNGNFTDWSLSFRLWLGLTRTVRCKTCSDITWAAEPWDELSFFCFTFSAHLNAAKVKWMPTLTRSLKKNKLCCCTLFFFPHRAVFQKPYRNLLINISSSVFIYLDPKGWHVILKDLQALFRCVEGGWWFCWWQWWRGNDLTNRDDWTPFWSAPLS